MLKCAAAPLGSGSREGQKGFCCAGLPVNDSSNCWEKLESSEESQKGQSLEVLAFGYGKHLEPKLHELIYFSPDLSLILDHRS